MFGRPPFRGKSANIPFLKNVKKIDRRNTEVPNRVLPGSRAEAVSVSILIFHQFSFFICHFSSHFIYHFSFHFIISFRSQFGPRPTSQWGGENMFECYFASFSFLNMIFL